MSRLSSLYTEETALAWYEFIAERLAQDVLSGPIPPKRRPSR
jgi:hypothetical protein